MYFIIYRDNMKLRIYVYKGVLTLRLPPFNPYIAIVIAVLSVSSSAVLVKLAAGVPARIIANYRLLLAVLIMTLYVLLKYRNELKAIKKKDWLLTTLAGVFLAFHFILWFESLNFTSVASSVVLVTLQPIFAFLGTYFIFCECFSFCAVISMIIALLVCFFIRCCVFLFFHFFLWFESLNFTSVASSVVLVTLQPIFAFLGTYFIFGERFSLGAVISMIIALLGSVIISWGDFQIGGMALVGDILAFLEQLRLLVISYLVSN